MKQKDFERALNLEHEKVCDMTEQQRRDYFDEIISTVKSLNFDFQKIYVVDKKTKKIKYDFETIPAVYILMIFQSANNSYVSTQDYVDIGIFAMSALFHEADTNGLCEKEIDVLSDMSGGICPVLLNNNMIMEAKQLIERVIELIKICKKPNVKTLDNQAKLIFRLGNILFVNRDFESSLNCLLDAKEILNRLYSIDKNSMPFDTYFLNSSSLLNCYIQLGNVSEIYKIQQEVENFYKKLSNKEKEQINLQYNMFLNSFGDSLVKLGEFDKGQEITDKAISAFEKMDKTDLVVDMISQAYMIKHVAYFYEQNYQKAVACAKKAVDYVNQMTGQTELGKLYRIAKYTYNLATSLYALGEVEKSVEQYYKVMNICKNYNINEAYYMYYMTIKELGLSLTKDGKLKEALQVYLDYLITMEMNVFEGDYALNLADINFNMFMIYKSLGETQNRIKYAKLTREKLLEVKDKNQEYFELVKMFNETVNN